jgi:hypothetical protein
MTNEQFRAIATIEREESVGDVTDMQARDRLTEFFKILMDVDQRQRRNEKNNRSTNNPN